MSKSQDIFNTLSDHFRKKGEEMTDVNIKSFLKLQLIAKRYIPSTRIYSEAQLRSLERTDLRQLSHGYSEALRSFAKALQGSAKAAPATKVAKGRGSSPATSNSSCRHFL